MKTLTLKLGDKLYTTSRIIARLSREALALQKDIIDAASAAKNVQTDGDDISDEDMDAVKNLMDTAADVSNRKLNLICEVYGNKFTADEVENNLTAEEIDGQIRSVMKGIRGIVEKN